MTIEDSLKRRLAVRLQKHGESRRLLLRWRRQRQSARRAQAQAMTIEKGVRDVSRVPGQGFDALGKIRLSSASTAMARPTSFSSSRR
jgi:hypothetical protein